MIETTIKSARRLIMEGIHMYLEKDERGDYVLPQNKQRPIYLDGPAGIGKTELVGQIADELKLGFVSYSMTHHTRQSVIGLPAIVEKLYDGNAYKATEYTMSEIIESVRNCVRKGYNEGILFLDEVNCVSETLTAAMLQFLQNKIFGTHRLPVGWVIIAAGNPPEYNKSVRRFDAVTRDRLRILHIKPDLDDWMEFAKKRGIHPVVLQYLEKNRNEFYQFGNHGKGGEKIVTARGWEDLSSALYMNERYNYAVDEVFVSQFIQEEKTASAFTGYYQTIRNIIDRESVLNILKGENLDEYVKKAGAMDYQKKWMIILLLISEIVSKCDHLSARLKIHDQNYNRLKERIGRVDADLSQPEQTTFEMEKEKFREETDILDQKLDEVERYINNILKFHERLFEGDAGKTSLMMILCQNKYIEKIMIYRPISALIDHYCETTGKINKERKQLKQHISL